MGRKKLYSREGVIEQALDLFWQKGFEGVSLKDLERQTGVNKSGLYKEFTSKEVLFEQCLLFYKKHQGDTLQAVLFKAPLSLDNIFTFLESSYALTGPKGCFIINTLRENTISTDAVKAVIADYFADLRKILMRVLRDIEQAQSRPLPLAPAELTELIIMIDSGACIMSFGGAQAHQMQTAITSLKTLLSRKD